MNIDEFQSTPFAGEFPKAIQEYLGLRSLEEIVNVSSAMGATRLVTCPPFEPFEALTLTFLDGEVHASLVVSDADAWERVACGETSASDSPFAPRERSFGIGDLPSSMQDWRRMADALERTDSCMSDNPDGISYFHLAIGKNLDSMRVWFNPTEEANPLPCRLLNDYLRIKARFQARG